MLLKLRAATRNHAVILMSYPHAALGARARQNAALAPRQEHAQTSAEILYSNLKDVLIQAMLEGFPVAGAGEAAQHNAGMEENTEPAIMSVAALILTLTLALITVVIP